MGVKSNILSLGCDPIVEIPEIQETRMAGVAMECYEPMKHKERQGDKQLERRAGP